MSARSFYYPKASKQHQGSYISRDSDISYPALLCNIEKNSRKSQCESNGTRNHIWRSASQSTRAASETPRIITTYPCDFPLTHITACFRDLAHCLHPSGFTRSVLCLILLPVRASNKVSSLPRRQGFFFHITSAGQFSEQMLSSIYLA
jgi:hypothetical protein